MVKDFFVKNGFQLAVYITASIGVVVTTYFAIKQDLLSVSNRVLAIEQRNAEVDPLVVRFIQLEERDKSLVDDVSELKQDMKDLLKVHGVKP